MCFGFKLSIYLVTSRPYYICLLNSVSPTLGYGMHFKIEVFAFRISRDVRKILTKLNVSNRFKTNLVLERVVTHTPGE